MTTKAKYSVRVGSRAPTAAKTQAATTGGRRVTQAMMNQTEKFPEAWRRAIPDMDQDALAAGMRLASLSENSKMPGASQTGAQPWSGHRAPSEEAWEALVLLESGLWSTQMLADRIGVSRQRLTHRMHHLREIGAADHHYEDRVAIYRRGPNWQHVFDKWQALRQ